MLTEEQKQDVYPAATLEDVVYNGGKAIDVESQFYYVDPNKVVASSGVAGLPTYQNNNGNPPYNSVNPYSNTSANSTKVYLTNANSNKMGLGIILKVMAGDKVNIYGKSYHKRPPGQGYKDAVSPLTVLDILNAFSGTAMITAKGVSSGDISSRPGFPNSVAGLVGNQPGQSKNQPKASIDWILFDEQFGYAGGGFDMVGAENTSNGTFKEHNLNTIPTITVPKNGYIYVYCANESQYDVFFDNLQVIHTRGPIVEETHYYPFGLTMAGISSNAVGFGTPNNKKRFIGQELASREFSDESGLDLYEFRFRNHDPQIGRFIQIDPLASDYVYNSTYAYAENKLGLGFDLEGLELYFFNNTPWWVNVAVENNSNILSRPLIESTSKATDATSRLPKIEEHHIIPRRFGNDPVIEAAKDGGFEHLKKGGENTMPLEKFSRSTGQGRHGNAPRMDQEIARRLNEFKEKNPNFTPEEAVEFTRNLVKDLKDVINNNPDKKINDLFISPPVSTSATDNTGKFLIVPTKELEERKKRLDYFRRHPGIM